MFYWVILRLFVDPNILVAEAEEAARLKAVAEAERAARLKAVAEAEEAASVALYMGANKSKRELVLPSFSYNKGFFNII